MQNGDDLAGRITVSVSIDDRKLTIEGPENFVRQEVSRLTSELKQLIQRDAVSGTPNALGPDQVPRTEKEFVEQKQPKGFNETIIVLAFWMKAKSRSVFDEGEMRRAFIRAGVRPPKAMLQALYDAKRNNDYLETTDAKGQFKLSDHGENVVRFELPRM